MGRRCQLNASGNAINLELANGAVWYPGCDSTIYNKGMNLNLHDGGIVDTTKTADQYADLNIGSADGTGGLFRLETDVVNMQSDKVNILASTDAGTHSIDIIDVNEGRWIRLLLMQVKGFCWQRLRMRLNLRLTNVNNRYFM